MLTSIFFHVYCLDDIGDQLCERVLGVLFEIWDGIII